MTMAHQAFAFDYAAFHDELRPVLLRALETRDTAGLAAWIDLNLSRLVHPYEDEPLTTGWQTQLEAGDVHELGELAVTKYYDTDLDIGLDADWEAIGELLEKAGLDPALMLGSALGPADAPFDPAREGAYFQSSADVSQALSQIQALLRAQPALASELAPLQGMLQQAARGARGLYVTF